MATCYLLLLFLGASEWRKMEKNEEDHNLHSSPLWKLAHHRQKVRRGKENNIFLFLHIFKIQTESANSSIRSNVPWPVGPLTIRHFTTPQTE